MASDVAERGGAKQCVANGVGKRVAIRVAERALFERNSHPAQNELSPAHQAMNVVANTDAKKRIKE